MSTSGLAAIYLKQALKKPGCPICRCCTDNETRYLQELVSESINHIETRVRLSHSLGLCQRHAWQALYLEHESLGIVLGNTIIYQSLLKLVLSRVRQVRRATAAQGQRSRLGRFLARERLFSKNASCLLAPSEKCRACELGAETARHYETVLVEMLAEDAFKDLYCASDGVCLPHLAEIVHYDRPCAGREYLLSQTEGRLERLALCLGEMDQAYRTWHLCDPIDSPASRSVGGAIAFMTGDLPTCHDGAGGWFHESEGLRYESHHKLL